MTDKNRSANDRFHCAGNQQGISSIKVRPSHGELTKLPECNQGAERLPTENISQQGLVVGGFMQALCWGFFSVAQRFFYLSSGWMCQEAPCGAQIYFPQQTGRLLELWQSIACVTNIQQLVVLAIDSTGM